MTRKADSRLPATAPAISLTADGRWNLRDARVRFSELVRRARKDGPQRVTLQGRDAVVVIDAEEFQRLKGQPTGAQLVQALQALPHDSIDIEPGRAAMPVRPAKL
jgi:prevent-host-death family protein